MESLRHSYLIRKQCTARGVTGGSQGVRFLGAPTQFSFLGAPTILVQKKIIRDFFVNLFCLTLPKAEILQFHPLKHENTHSHVTPTHSLKHLLRDTQTQPPSQRQLVMNWFIPSFYITAEPLFQKIREHAKQNWKGGGEGAPTASVRRLIDNLYCLNYQCKYLCHALGYE